MSAKPRVFREALRGMIIAARCVYNGHDDHYKTTTQAILKYAQLDTANKLHMKLLKDEFGDDAEAVKQLL